MKRLIVLFLLLITLPAYAALKVPGDGSDYLSVSQNGVQTMHGDARYTQQRKYHFNYAKITGQGAPTLVYRGVSSGFSLPIYNNNDEEITSCECAPSEWDNSTSVTFYIGGWLDTANTDKKFKLQLSLSHWTAGDIIPDTSTDIEVETETGTAGQYKSFKIAFLYDAPGDGIAAGDAISIRIRRIAASENEATGEFVVEGAIAEFTCNKLGGSL